MHLKNYSFLLVAALLGIAGCPSNSTDTARDGTNADGETTDGSPSVALLEPAKFDAANFSNPTKIDNQWFPLKPGTRFIWEGTTVDEEGDVEAHSVSFTVTDLTKEIDGVKTLVCWDRDFVDGELEEAEIVFFAQDDDGNVWHFGEYPEEYSNGVIEATPGWSHSINGQAGIHMPGDPKVGDAPFAQGLAADIPWTDRAVVSKAGEKVTVPTGSYEDVMVFDESNAEEPDAHQLKYYAPGVGNIKVGFSGEEQSQEEMVLVKLEQISDEDLAAARQAALDLETSALEHCPDVFGKLKPSTPLPADAAP